MKNILSSLFKGQQKPLMSPQRVSHDVHQVMNLEYQRTGKQIQEGLAKKTAGTGKPIKELKGAAKRSAQMANIGGGSKATGGGGMDKGFDIIVRNRQAYTGKKVLEYSEQKKLPKK